jgi:hypothetical protein
MKLCRTVHCPESPTPWMRQFTLGARKTQQQAELRRQHRTYQVSCREGPPKLSSAPFVSMVQAAHLRNGNDTTVLRSIDGSRLRGVFRQG